MTIAPEIAVATLGTMSSAAGGMGTASAGGVSSGTAAATAGTQGAGQAASWKQVLEQMGVSQTDPGPRTDAAGQTAEGRGADTGRATAAAQQGTASDGAVTQQAAGSKAQQGSATTAKVGGTKTAQAGTQKKDGGKQDAALSGAPGVDAMTAAALASQTAVQAPQTVVQSVAAADESAKGGDAPVIAMASAGFATAGAAAQPAATGGALVTQVDGTETTSPDFTATQAAAQSSDAAVRPARLAAGAANAAADAGIAPVQEKGIAATRDSAVTSDAGATMTLKIDAAQADEVATAAPKDASNAKAAATQGSTTGTTTLKTELSTVGAGNGGATVANDPAAAQSAALPGPGATAKAETPTETRSIAAAQRAGSRVHGATAEAARTATSGTTASAQDTTASSMMRESGVALATGPNAQGTDGQAAATTSGASAHATFAALDSGSASAAATWTQTGAHAAEAGYRDPVLGWVSVRAEQDAAGVHATVIPVSQDAAQSLGTHLAGLNAYLAEHNSAVNTVAIAAPDASGAGMGQGMSSRSDQGQQSGGQDTAPAGVSFGAMERGGATSSNTDAAAMAVVGSSGTYISVLA